MYAKQSCKNINNRQYVQSKDSSNNLFLKFIECSILHCSLNINSNSLITYRRMLLQAKGSYI